MHGRCTLSDVEGSKIWTASRRRSGSVLRIAHARANAVRKTKHKCSKETDQPLNVFATELDNNGSFCI